MTFESSGDDCRDTIEPMILNMILNCTLVKHLKRNLSLFKVNPAWYFNEFHPQNCIMGHATTRPFSVFVKILKQKIYDFRFGYA